MRKFSRQKTPLCLPPDGIFQLVTGWDFFRSAWGNDYTLEVIAAMRSAWRDPEIRKAVIARTYSYGPHARPFAHFLFGPDGRNNGTVTAADVAAARAACCR
jgi:hypothetical protein